ncbi:hypothetical protein [Methanolobus sp.]|uniref:hypothetical protein n=1 Tax=Methanolobus sp. TaxID=1874737 RepID=UPI0025D6CBD0|nr:hypothetical protein [Methanolobus sp.]
MRIKKILFLFVVLALISAPAVSAKEEYTICSSTEEHQPVIIKAYSTITQGQTKTYTTTIGTTVKKLEVDLNWGDTSDYLSLAIYTPSGAYVGKFYDNADGSVDGRIHLDITQGQNYLQSGKWTFKVRGESVVGTEDYYFNTFTY